MVTALFKDGQITTTTKSLSKYDYGEVLRIKGLSLPQYVAVQFVVNGMSEALPSVVGETVDGITDVLIPNSLLRSDIQPWNYNIIAYIYIVSGNSGKTEYTITIPVKWRPKTGDDQAADSEVAAVIGEAVDKMNTAAAKAEAAATKAVETAERISADREKITANEAEIYKIQQNYIKSAGINIARESNLIRKALMEATTIENEDKTITVTPSINYGRYNFLYKLEATGQQRFYYIACTIKGTNISQVSLACYIYGSSNLGQLKVIATDIKKEGGKYYIAYLLCDNIDKQQETGIKLDVGIMTNANQSYIIAQNPFVIVDVTKKEAVSSADLLGLISLYGYDYFVNAETAETAETLLFSLVNRGSTDFSLVGNDGCTFTPTQMYYGFQIRPDFAFTKNGKILLVIETDFSSNDTATFVAGQQKAGGSGYENTIGLTFYKKIEDKYIYYCMLPITTNGANSIDIYHGSKLYVGTPHTVTIKKIGYAISDSVTDRMIRLIVNNETLLDLYNSVDELVKSTEKTTNSVINTWKNKKVLAIGDSITAAQKWQKKLNEMLEMNVYTHAKGGVGTVAMVDGDKGLGGDYDNETSASGTLKPLSVDDVKDKDLIVVLPAYNDRGKADGTVGDCYNPSGSGQNTIAGVVQYTINRIYEELTNAGNLKCKILYATPHCAGRYPYIDADGYDEYPSGTGRTMETLANTIVAVCNHNNIPVCDLWHNSGINKNTWNVFGSNSNPVNSQYSPYKLKSTGEPENTQRIRYTKGTSYYQVRNGEVKLEEYTGSAPYPYNADQLHCSEEGYARLGECIVGSVITHYGN